MGRRRRICCCCSHTSCLFLSLCVYVALLTQKRVSLLWGPPQSKDGLSLSYSDFSFPFGCMLTGGRRGSRERNGLEARIEGETERSSAQKDGCNLGGLLPFPPKNISGNLNAFSWPGRKYLITFFPAAI